VAYRTRLASADRKVQATHPHETTVPQAAKPN
jgi:hypothetical protein